MSRSVLGSETMAFAHSFALAFIIGHEIQRMMNIKIPIMMFTDSLSLFDVITKASTTVEKSLMIDLEVVEKAYQQIEMEQIGFIGSEHNLADWLTKINSNNALINTLKGARFTYPVDQRIDRSHNEDTSRQK